MKHSRGSNTSFDIAVGQSLRFYRVKEKTSQHEVAMIMGLQQGQWSRYEAGFSMTPFETILKFCDVCLVDINDFSKTVKLFLILGGE